MFEEKIRDLKVREDGAEEIVCSLSEVAVKSLDGEVVIELRGETYRLTPVGMEMLCRMGKVPSRYLEDIPLDLRIKNLRNGLNLAREAKFLVNGKKEVRGVCSKSYKTPLLSEQLLSVQEALWEKGKISFYELHNELCYAIVGFPRFTYEGFTPSIYLRLSDIGGKEEMVCGLHHERGVFVPLVEPSLYLTHSQSYAGYSVEKVKSTLQTMLAMIVEGHDLIANSATLAHADVVDVKDWVKGLAMSSLSKSFLRSLKAADKLSRFDLAESLMVVAPSLRHYYDSLLKFSREINNQFSRIWLSEEE